MPVGSLLLLVSGPIPSGSMLRSAVVASGRMMATLHSLFDDALRRVGCCRGGGACCN